MFDFISLIVIISVACKVCSRAVFAKNQDAETNKIQQQALQDIEPSKSALSSEAGQSGRLDTAHITEKDHASPRRSREVTCPRCENLFNPEPDESGISKCPYCGKGFIL